MKEIKELAHQIRDELDVAEEYAKCAVKLKDERPSESSTYAEMARQELGHADTLHKMAARAIEKARESGAAVPAGMETVWEWEHDNMIDRTARIRAMLGMA